MHYSENIINAAVDVIITTRDFCGNEREAVIDFAADNGLRGEYARTLYKIANFRANAKWNIYKRDAGVPEKYIF